MFSDTGQKEVIAFVSRLVWYFILKMRKRILKILKVAYTALSNFFNRIAYRKGEPAAISATASNLAVIIWNMIVKGVPYKSQSDYEFLDRKRKKKCRE